MTSFEGTSAQSYSDADAVTGVQLIVSDTREARTFEILDSGERLRLTYPITLAEGYYDRSTADPNNQVEYYISNASGGVGQTGTILWRSRSDGARRRITGNIDSIMFVDDDDTQNSIRVTVVARNDVARGSRTASLTERLVYLRNHP